MRVLSKLVCGFRRDGRVLLQKGMNVLTEPLTATERAFIVAMEKAKLIEVITEDVPEPPSSETRVSVVAATSSRLDVEEEAPRKPMRTRRGGGA